MPASAALIEAEMTFAVFPPMVAVTGLTGMEGTAKDAAEPLGTEGWTAP
jgi:hypothetical protein